MKDHKDIWPHVEYTNNILLKSITLSSLLAKEQINPSDYQALVMDKQGSEFLLLHGAADILENFKYIKTEIADFEAYEGSAQIVDFESFMKKHGYEEFSCKKFASRKAGGGYYDIVYTRTGGKPINNEVKNHFVLNREKQINLQKIIDTLDSDLPKLRNAKSTSLSIKN